MNSGRREVTDIKANDDHSGYTITARHWEPKHYLDAIETLDKDRADSQKRGSVGHQLLFGSALGFALGAVVCKKLLPAAALNLPEHADKIQLLIGKPLVVYVALVIVCTLVALVLAPGGPSGKKAEKKSSMDIPSVGTNGRMVTVEEMKKGGSGSASVMQGETVEIETIRTKFVVNAAGCYSVCSVGGICLSYVHVAGYILPFSLLRRLITFPLLNMLFSYRTRSLR